MRRWKRASLVVVALLVVAAGGAYWWLLVDPQAPADTPVFGLDLGKMRTLAGELPGEKPTEVRVETVAIGSVPQAFALAGGGWGGVPLGFFAYQLVFPHQAMILDAGADEATGRQFGAAFQPEAFAAVTTALARAAQIVVTHEHPDHMGAILDYPEPNAIVARLSLTIEQIAAAPGYLGADKPPPILAEAHPIVYEDYFPVAPGVVLIKAPGHSPGSQMVFVTLADGREYLFAGDIGWLLANLEAMRGRPRVTAGFMLGEDTAAVLGQLRALGALRAAEPGIVVVPGHDLEFIENAVAKDTMTAGFVRP